ncbi:MAG: hypothetical protein AAGA56_13145, partial [Myxococcota bacterium]
SRIATSRRGPSAKKRILRSCPTRPQKASRSAVSASWRATFLARAETVAPRCEGGGGRARHHAHRAPLPIVQGAAELGETSEGAVHAVAACDQGSSWRELHV